MAAHYIHVLLLQGTINRHMHTESKSVNILRHALNNASGLM